MRPNCLGWFLSSLLLWPSLALAATYYVRTDGGDAAQCTGLADAPYPGSGAAQPCAFSHPFWALPPEGSGSPLLQGGDTLLIGPGEYPIGFGAPNTSYCDSSFPWDCYPSTIPSGPDAAHPTKIYGRGWDTRTGAKPVLWGTERVSQILQLGAHSHIDLRWLEITDHSSCLNNSPDIAKACNRSSFPYGEYADTGIAAFGAQDIHLKDLNIHGLAVQGVVAGKIADWVVEDVALRGNAITGWQGDAGAGSSNSGSLAFRRVNVEYNGCGEIYPGIDLHGCFGPEQGGGGNGLASSLNETTGGDWLFEECNFSHNTLTGLFLNQDTNASLSLRRSRAEGNADTQIHIRGGSRVSMENSVVIANCDYFSGQPMLETQGAAFAHCRSGENALNLIFSSGQKAALVNSTFWGRGYSLIYSGGTACTGEEQFISRNNLFAGDWAYGSGNTYKTRLYLAGGATGVGDGPCASLALDNAYGMVYNFEESDLCPNSNQVACADPLFQGPLAGDAYNVMPVANSPARDNPQLLAGSAVLNGFTVPATDTRGAARPPDKITWGAYELSPYASPTAASTLPALPGDGLALLVTPNPFRASQGAPLRLRFRLPLNATGSLAIYNLTGKKYFDQLGLTGGQEQSLYWDGKEAGSGIYFVILENSTQRIIKKIVVIR